MTFKVYVMTVKWAPPPPPTGVFECDGKSMGGRVPGFSAALPASSGTQSELLTSVSPPSAVCKWG